MSDFQDQLAELRRRIAKINRKYAPGKPSTRPLGRERPERYFPEEWLSGQEVETEYGRHYETEKLYERHRRMAASAFAIWRACRKICSNRSRTDRSPASRRRNGAFWIPKLL